MSKSVIAPWQQLQTLLLDPLPLARKRFLCEQCQEALPLFITDELARQPIDTLYPDVARHLDECPRCLAEYEALSQLTELALYG